MKKQITSTDPFVFSLRGKLLRFAARLATHGALWLIPVLLFAGVLPHPGSRSETLAAAFLSACILILIRALGAQLLSLAEKLAPDDAEAVAYILPNTKGGNPMKFRSLITRLSAAALALALALPLAACDTKEKEIPATSGDYHIIQPWIEGIRAVAPDQKQGTGIVPENTRESYNAGSCRQLKDNPYLLVIFLDDDESCWNEKQVLKSLDELVMPAESFMEENARQWGVALDLRIGYYATYGHPDRPVKYNGVIKTYNNGTSRDLLEQAAATLGFSSKEEMHEKMMELSGQEQVGYVFMLNKGGRSYSGCYSNRHTGSAGDYRMEYSVIYSGFTDTSHDTGSDTVAHEVLHMFGAEDYYYPDSRKFLARKYYPKDIMLCSMPALEYFELGDFTAYTLGWTDQEPAICSDPGWW